MSLGTGGEGNLTAEQLLTEHIVTLSVDKDGTIAALEAKSDTGTAETSIVAGNSKITVNSSGDPTYFDGSNNVILHTGNLSDTDDLAEGGVNLYFSDERAQDAVATALVAGTHTGITVDYDDVGNVINLAVTPIEQVGTRIDVYGGVRCSADYEYIRVGVL